MGAALVLKGTWVKGEVFTFDALRCDNSHAHARYSGRQFCDSGRIKADNGIPTLTEHPAIGPGGTLPSHHVQEEVYH